MKRISGSKILNVLGWALAVFGGFEIALAFIITLTGGLDLGPAFAVAGVFAIPLVLGIWMIRRAHRYPRVRQMEPARKSSTQDSTAAQESAAAEKLAATEQLADEPADKPATEVVAAPEAATVPASPAVPAPKTEVTPKAKLAPAPKPAPTPEPFSSYEETAADTRVFKIPRDQINLAPCPELENFTAPYDHKVAATVALALREHGYEMTNLIIGGGSTEVSHTGAVEYGGTYSSLDEFISTASENYARADAKATEDYGIWFSGLNWFFVRTTCKRDESLVGIDIDAICKVTLTWTCRDWSHFKDEVATVKRYLCEGSR